MSTILYKYIDLDGGWAMLWKSDLQYTNASQLNDPFDCHPKLLDFSNIPVEIRGDVPEEWYREKLEEDANNKRKDTWLCSLSKVNDSILMWSHYCYNHSGMCIGLDVDKVCACVPAMFGSRCSELDVYEVQYQDILERPDFKKTPLAYQLSTKAKDWAYEQEVRLVIDQPFPFFLSLNEQQMKQCKKEWDWEEQKCFQPLTGDCFESIYFGVKIDREKRDKIIEHMRKKLNPATKFYQMKIDPEAFRLKAEEIN